MPKKYLVLENGSVFAGESFGSCRDAAAEIVFNTNMVGYTETLTDPNYEGQAVVQTFPLIGNYGVNPEDFENTSNQARVIFPAAYIVREHCIHPSNFRAKLTLDAFLRQHDVPGLCGVDTRALVRMLRSEGTMNGAIVDDPASADMDALKKYRVSKPVPRVTCKEPYTMGEGVRNVVLLDLGTKKTVIDSLVSRGVKVTVCPADSTADRIISADPDGILLSGGPGDPTDNPGVVSLVKKLINTRVPIMGIGLGHQLLALACGFETEKLPYGHRGGNQPVRSDDGQIYITTQNHGYNVKSSSVNKATATELFVNVNDGSNEGLIYHSINAFSVQFQPEAHRCADSTSYLYDRFISMMEE